MSAAGEQTLAVTGDDLALLAAAAADVDQPRSTLGAVGDLAARRMAAIVFSASRRVGETSDLERIFTSRPDVYPAGIRKSKRETHWAQHVLRERRVFVGEGPLEMAAAFDDQDLMASVGIRSIINVPIVLRRTCVGVLNFGRASDRVPPVDVLLARFLALAATTVFALDERR